MKIGIIEIMPKGHYTLVESLIEIYSSDPLNEIFIFTHQLGYNTLQPVLKSSSRKITIIYKSDSEKLSSFFQRVNNYNLDKLYIVTLEKYFKNFISIGRNSPIFLFVHNIEDWFQLSLKVLIYRFFINIFKCGQFIYYFKVCFINPIFKNKIKKNVLESGGKFVVLNRILKDELSKFVTIEKIEVVPFSVYSPKLKLKTNDKQLLHVCIPGILDNERRDYFAIFKCLEDNLKIYKDRLELNLLGGINDRSDKIIKEAEILISKGFKIKYYKMAHIPIEEYNELLNGADIILGNLNIFLNKYSIYGKTKDTGAIFVMIKFGKPGILPQNYALINELKTSTLTYNSYEELVLIFKKLITEPESLIHLTEEAIKNSQYFEPKIILNSL